MGECAVVLKPDSYKRPSGIDISILRQTAALSSIGDDRTANIKGSKTDATIEGNNAREKKLRFDSTRYKLRIEWEQPHERWNSELCSFEHSRVHRCMGSLLRSDIGDISHQLDCVN